MRQKEVVELCRKDVEVVPKVVADRLFLLEVLELPQMPEEMRCVPLRMLDVLNVILRVLGMRLASLSLLA